MKTKNNSVLEELCRISDEETIKKVFGQQYDVILDNLAYIFKEGYKDTLDTYYRLNGSEMNQISKDRMKIILSKGLKKIGYSNFDIDFDDTEQIKVGIYGYNIATIYKMLSKKNNKKRGKYK